MGKSRPPLKEIAQTLNLSPATVSLVLHNRPGVSSETRDKVIRQLRTNGYQENQAAPANKSVHLLKYSVSGYYTGKNDGFVNSIFDAITLEARALNCDIAINSCHEGEFQKVLEPIIDDPLDGMILMGTDLPLVYGSYLRDYKSPVILVDTYVPSCCRDSVVVNNEQCISAALDNLCSNGHTKIGFVYSCFKTYNFVERLESFASGMRRRNLEMNQDYTYPVNPLMERTYDNIVSVMKAAGSMPSALIADNDAIAVGMLNALKNAGFRVPDDISIISIGDTLFCRMTSPPLSVVQVPADYIGKTAMRNLYDRILAPNTPIRLTCISGELISRESVARLI